MSSTCKKVLGFSLHTVLYAVIATVIASTAMAMGGCSYETINQYPSATETPAPIQDQGDDPVQTDDPTDPDVQPTSVDDMVDPGFLEVCYKEFDVAAHLIEAQVVYRRDNQTHESVFSNTVTANCLIFFVDKARVAEGFQIVPQPWALYDNPANDERLTAGWFQEIPSIQLDFQPLTVQEFYGYDVEPGNSFFAGRMTCEKETMRNGFGTCWELQGYDYRELVDCFCSADSTVKCIYEVRQQLFDEDGQYLGDDRFNSTVSYGCAVWRDEAEEPQTFACFQGNCDWDQPIP